MTAHIELDGQALNLGLELIQRIARFQPFSSISFMATERVLTAVEESSRLVDWGMAKNKHKMKATAVEIMEQITEADPGDPINLNLDGYELDSMAAAADLIERTLDNRVDGVLLTSQEITD